MLKYQIKTLLISVAILFCFIAAEVIFISAITQSLPNQIKITVIENISFYIDLLNANPAMASKLALIENPLLIVQRVDEQKIEQIWGLYFMPVNLITLYILSLLIIRAKKLKLNTYKWSGIWIASFILIASTLYLRIQTCCTSGPTWSIEIWLFSQINNPFSDTAFWQDLYILLLEWFTLIQFGMAAIGMAILFIIYYKNPVSRNVASSTNSKLINSEEAN